MAQDSKIEWCDDTTNPWWGCVRVSAACRHCYAESLDARFGGRHWGATAPRKFRLEKALSELETIARRAAREGRVRRVFVASMADVFEDRADVNVERQRFLTAVRSHEGMRDNLRLLLLTKRPAVMAAWAAEHGWEPWWWAGTTIENQRAADERLPHLLRVPARVRFVSCEPLLEHVNLAAGLWTQPPRGLPDESPEAGGMWRGPTRLRDKGLHWIIAGGESGPRARPMHPDWARSLRDQAQRAGVAFHFKQWGEWRLVGDGYGVAIRVGKRDAGRLLDGRTWDELPADGAL